MEIMPMCVFAKSEKIARAINSAGGEYRDYSRYSPIIFYNILTEKSTIGANVFTPLKKNYFTIDF